MKKWCIAIVGAGPAGLVAAIAARKLGLDVTVFEQADNFAQIGGGILIHSNGQRVLSALGLLASFEPQMMLATRGIIEVAGGKTLAESDFALLDIPYNRAAVVLRYQLQEHLLSAARALGVAVNFAHRFVKFERQNSHAKLNFENGFEFECDVAIAADGLHSRLREASGIEFEKITVGEGWLRGISPVQPSRKAFREIWGDDGRRFGISPLADDTTYFYCRAPLGEWQNILENSLPEWIESWRAFGEDPLTLLRGVTDWRKVNYNELYEIKAREWSRPPVFLVGDAAHSMTPNLGQGANSSMVDALVLVRMLARVEGQRDALERVGREYTALRRPFVTEIQNAARQAGDLASKTSSAAHFMRDGLFALTRNITALQKKTLRLLAGYNPREEEFFAPFK